MNKMIVIGITGKAGAGKDTLAEALTAELGTLGTVHTMGFADPIRIIARMLGFDLSRDRKEQEQLVAHRDIGDTLFNAVEQSVPLMPAAMRAALYAKTAEHFGIPVDGSPGSLTLSPRVFMQQLGTEVGQRVDRLIWVNYLKARISNLGKHSHGKQQFVLVPDMRFKHEVPIADVVLRVIRPGVQEVASHVSERIALRYDYTILNDKDIEYLNRRAYQFVHQHLETLV